MKKIIMIAVPVVLILAGAAYFFLLKPSGPPPDEKKLAQEPGITYTIADPFIVNLADSGTRRFAKVGVALEVSKLSMALVPPQEGAEPEKIEMEPEIRDIIIAAIQEKTSEELSTKAGRDEVKKHIVTEVNKDTELKITKVFYTEFAVQ